MCRLRAARAVVVEVRQAQGGYGGGADGAPEAIFDFLIGIIFNLKLLSHVLIGLVDWRKCVQA